MWYDSHCHLDFKDFDGQHDKLVSQLAEQGCKGVLVPSVGVENFSAVLDLKSRYPEFAHIALGLHPYFLDQHQDAHLEVLAEYVRVHRQQLVALGEIGLDFFDPSADKDRQIFLFSAQIKQAAQSQLPLILHSRKSHDIVIKLLRQFQFEYGGIIHGFSGSLQQARHFTQLGFVIGLGGAVTHERAKAMHKLAEALDDHEFVLETDAPDMRPSFALDRSNTPLNLPQIAQHIAGIRQQPLDYIYTSSSENFERTILSLAEKKGNP